jgi:pyridoxamine 5'-phosphate oxidase
MTVDPFVLFEEWYAEARQDATASPYSVALATASATARPAVRMVYYRGIREGGFSFFTNYDSRKGREIAENPFASMLFYWSHLRKQVRVEGRVERLSAAESDSYFESRPLESRITAVVSRQSETMAEEAAFIKELKDLEACSGGVVNRPDYWGGYALTPSYFEFWISREHRRHSRIAYSKQRDVWTAVRLYP